MPTASNVLCRCGRFMRPEKNGVTVEERLEDGRPYKLWDADLWSCPECGNEVIAGFGAQPIVEHYQQPDYDMTRKRFAAAGPIYPGRSRTIEDEQAEIGPGLISDPRR